MTRYHGWWLPVVDLAWRACNHRQGTSLVDECASHVTLFSTQALSLELAGERRFATLAALAIN